MSLRCPLLQILKPKQRALEDCLRDEPDWSALLRVEEIELAGVLQSAN